MDLRVIAVLLGFAVLLSTACSLSNALVVLTQAVLFLVIVYKHKHQPCLQNDNYHNKKTEDCTLSILYWKLIYNKAMALYYVKQNMSTVREPYHCHHHVIKRTRSGGDALRVRRISQHSASYPSMEGGGLKELQELA
jgi:hypothetical protein